MTEIKTLDMDDETIIVRKCVKFIKKCMKYLFIVLLMICIIKTVWFLLVFKAGDSFEEEKSDILKRRNYLINQTRIEPQEILDKMPTAVGEQFQGEWAIYTCSMLCTALTNIAFIFPETKDEAIEIADSLIRKTLSPEIRKYDQVRWGEDPLESLSGGNSHISYLSHLHWMIGAYKYLGGGKKYDNLYHTLSSTINRRLLKSSNLSLQTYPGERVYVPDMLVAIASMANYAKLYNGKYSGTVNQWMKYAKTTFKDQETGLLSSFLTKTGKIIEDDEYSEIRGSFSALNCFYLYYVDEKFAADQYEKMKQLFLRDFMITGFREYKDFRFNLLGFDIDSGPIIFGLSPSGTAFSIGSATFAKDFKLRKKLLHTAELAGSSVQYGDEKHYLLSNTVLVGEAIVLAMKTATVWDQRYLD